MKETGYLEVNLQMAVLGRRLGELEGQRAQRNTAQAEEARMNDPLLGLYSLPRQGDS